MSDELLLKEIENLRQEKEALVVSKRGNLVWYGIGIATVVTASFQLWYGLAAVAGVFLFALANRPHPAPLPLPKETGVYLVQYDGAYDYGIYVELEDGTKRKLAKGFLTYQMAMHQLEWIRAQRNKNG